MKTSIMSLTRSAGTLLGIAGATSKAPAIVAVAGCGGKTTFIESLAWEYRHKKVLVTPTAKIMPMNGKNAVLRTTLPECAAHIPVKGIQCLGVYNDKTGKLESLPPNLLAKAVPLYDIVLLEADGSRGLPCKGWLPNEPVIPRYCTHTVGIVTLNAIGKPAKESTVQRMPEFLRLTGLQKGDTITRQVLIDMVCDGEGMFRYGVGSQNIFVNHVENASCAAIAAEWLGEIKQAYPGRFDCLAYGSARTNIWKEI